MEKEAAGSEIERQQSGQVAGVEKDTQPDQAAVVEKADTPSSAAGGGGTSAPPQQKTKWTAEEREAANEFVRAALDEYDVYEAMSEEDVEEEYRRAGKLHKYDPEMELQKRWARVAKKHPPPPGYFPHLEQDFKLIEDDED